LKKEVDEKDKPIFKEVLAIVESFHLEGKSDLGMIGPEEFFNIMMAMYD